MPGGERACGGHSGVGVGGASILEQGWPSSILSPGVTRPPRALLPQSLHHLTHPNKSFFSEVETGDPGRFRRKLGAMGMCQISFISNSFEAFVFPGTLVG